MGGHEAAPARDERPVARGLGVVDRLQERHLQAIDLVAEPREHRDEQRVRDEDRGQHAERRPDAELRDEVEAEEGEPVTEIATVTPAKITARPADAPASAAASSGVAPRAGAVGSA